MRPEPAAASRALTQKMLLKWGTTVCPLPTEGGPRDAGTAVIRFPSSRR